MVYIMTVFISDRLILLFFFFKNSQQLAFLTFELLCKVLSGQNGVSVHYVPEMVVIVGSNVVKAQQLFERSQECDWFYVE